MVKQYPHTIKLFPVEGGSVKDANGNWKAAVAVVPERSYKCRMETRSTAGFITGTDGTQLQFSCIVYMPLPVDDIQVMTRVDIYKGDVLVASGTVKQFSRGQLNARAWL